jgi:DNA-binding transcriptional ArsR family regulator
MRGRRVLRNSRICDLLWTVDVTGPDWAVLVTLALHADSAGSCAPSLGRVASLTRLSVSTVRRSLRRLEKADLVATVHRDGFPNEYALNLGHLDDRPTSVTHLTGPPRSNGARTPVTAVHLTPVTQVTDEGVEGVEIEEASSPPSPAQSAAPTTPNKPDPDRSAFHDATARNLIDRIQRDQLGQARRRRPR